LSSSPSSHPDHPQLLQLLEGDIQYLVIQHVTRLPASKQASRGKGEREGYAEEEGRGEEQPATTNNPNHHKIARTLAPTLYPYPSKPLPCIEEDVI
jgi:hypothetical protein